MKFTLSAIFLMAASAMAGPLASESIVDTTDLKLLSVETGITPTDQMNITTSGVSIVPRTGTEVVTCYNFGTKADRAPLTTVIDDWCRNHAIGKFVPKGETIWARYNYGTFTVLVSGAALTNCNGFTVDGNCNRLLRLPVDGCNTSGVNGKQGGFITDLCGQWRTDPGSNGSDV